MANAFKLESGSWRVQASKTTNGVTVRKSLTVSPDEFGGDSRKAKAKAELLAREWRLNKKAETSSNPYFKQAMESYMDDRRNILSKSTIYTYERLFKSYEPLHNIHIEDITNKDIQRLLNNWSAHLAESTITHRLRVLYSVLKYYNVDTDFNLTIPKNTKPPKEVNAPETEEVKLLLKNANGVMNTIISLAAFGTLRRGEISALKQKYVSRENNTISIHATMVYMKEKGKKGEWFYKPVPKTKTSFRTVELPKYVIDLLPKSDDPESFVFENITPDMITSRFDRLRDRLKLTCTFHSLRHYAASFRSDLLIPTKYIEEVGGWRKNSKTLQRIYDNRLKASSKKYSEVANNFVKEEFFKCI